MPEAEESSGAGKRILLEDDVKEPVAFVRKFSYKFVAGNLNNFILMLSATKRRTPETDAAGASDRRRRRSPAGRSRPRQSRMPQSGFYLCDIRVRGTADQIAGAEISESVGHAVWRCRPTDDQRTSAEAAGVEPMRDARVR